jgi:phosphoribosylformylglycinamidine synthase
LLGVRGGAVPSVDLRAAPRIMKTVSRAVKRGLIGSCHDLSEAGLGLAIAEMALAGGIGAKIDLDLIPYRGGKPRPDFILFAESNTRFLAEVEPRHGAAFKKICAGLPCAKIGRTTALSALVVNYRGKNLINLPVRRLRRSWLRKIVF